jgi:molecular chaperone GrpE
MELTDRAEKECHAQQCDCGKTCSCGETGKQIDLSVKEADDAVKETVTGVTAEVIPEEIEKMQQELEQTQQQYLRLMADFENYKRRTRNDLAVAGKAALHDFMGTLLPVLDNFERSLEVGGDSYEAFKTGVEMIYRQLSEVLQQAGLEQDNPVGKPFDPTIHEAVSLVDGESEHPVVKQVFRRGYLFKGQLLRPSMVQVGPGDQPAEE